MLVLPVHGGVVIRRLRPEFSERCRSSLHYTLLTGILGLAAAIMVVQRDCLAAELRQTAAAAELFVGLALLGGLVFGRLLRFSKADILTVGIVFAVRNVALAMAIAVTLLNRTSTNSGFGAPWIYLERRDDQLVALAVAFCRCWKP